MRIAQVAPLYESVPPRLYGGTERVVSNLTEELVRLGHDVTLFASGDSVTNAKLVPTLPQALRLADVGLSDLAAHYLHLENVMRCMHDFDVIHYHVDFLHFPMSRRHSPGAHLTTLHGRLDLQGLHELYDEYDEQPVVSISQDQMRHLPSANWLGTVYHGMPGHTLRPSFASGTYLAFLGRIAPEKRPDRAIEIAKRAGVPLKIAAKVDPADVEYFESRIRPLLDHPLIEFIGEIGDSEKESFLSNALAMLFPIDWPEPFGLVMIEAMACGTPTIAFKNGSVPEIIRHGVAGLLVETVDEAVRAVARVSSIDRRACRREFDDRFSVERMADDYVSLYRRLISGRSVKHRVLAAE